MKKYVYMFPEGNGKMRELLGGKGANLAEMTGLGMPVPQGFTITTDACTQYYADGRQINDEITADIFGYGCIIFPGQALSSTRREPPCRKGDLSYGKFCFFCCTECSA